QVGTAYSAALVAGGGTTPYTWPIASGSLPAGLRLAAPTGEILGTPAATGTLSFTVSVKDSSALPKPATQVPAIFIGLGQRGTRTGSCQSPTTAGATSSFQNDVSSPGTCLTVPADNITSDLSSHTVTYNSASQTSAVHAIAVTSANSKGFTVRNGPLTEGSGAS